MGRRIQASFRQAYCGGQCPAQTLHAPPAAASQCFALLSFGGTTDSSDAVANISETTCPPRVTFILRHTNSTNDSRKIVNFDEVEAKLAERGILYQALDLSERPDLLTFRGQIRFAESLQILVTPHGQALWLTHFMPATSSVVELLPYGFPYSAYTNIAASHGLENYTQLEMDQPWKGPTGTLGKLAEQMWRSNRHLNISDIEQALLTFPEWLQPGSYKQAADRLAESLNISIAKANPVYAKVYARNQPLRVNPDRLVELLSSTVRYQETHCF